MTAQVRFTDVEDGSFATAEPQGSLAARRVAVTGVPCTWLRQIHGAVCVVVTEPGGSAGVEADAAVTAVPGAALSVISADCAPVMLASSNVVGAVHAGWRGLVAGVISETVEKMRELGAGEITAWLGPCIRDRCYEFGSDDLDLAASVFGEDVRSRTAWGTPALNVSEGVRLALGHSGVHNLVDGGVCTACSPVHWSHRARRDLGRQGAFIWLEN